MVLTGLPGRPIHGIVAQEPEPDRRAGPHPQLPELLGRAHLLQHRPHVVVLAHADAGGGDQQVGLPRRGQVLAKALPGVASHTEVHRFAPGEAHQGDERVGIAAGDLPAAQDLLGLVHVDDLVAAAHDGDARAPVHQRVGHGERGQDTEFRGAEQRALPEHDGAATNVLADMTEIGPGVAVLDGW